MYHLLFYSCNNDLTKKGLVPGQQSEFSREALTTIWYNVLCNFNIYILNFEIVIAVDDLGHYQSSFLLRASNNYLNGWRGFLKLIQLNRNSCLKEFLPVQFELTFAILLSQVDFGGLQIGNQIQANGLFLETNYYYRERLILCKIVVS